MKFEKFSIASEIKTNLNRMGFVRTTDIQFKAIPPILNGEDVLAIAQTGTGKTAAFAIPIVNQIHIQKTSRSSYGVKCLVLTPTRELAKQLGQVFAKVSKGTKANTYAIYGGVDQDPQKDQLATGIDILVATPGRMFDLISQGDLQLEKIQILVLDEADHMLDLGFIKDIEAIKRKLRKRHQTLFFSATINPKIKKLAYSQINSAAMRIQVSPEKIVSDNITHFIAKVEMDNKRHVLGNFLKENPEAKTMVFVRTQVRGERVQKHLAKLEIPTLLIHGSMEQNLREEAFETFKSQKTGVLIATDISARGLDIEGISHVVNYDLPEDPENYVHRIGRTGRAFAKGDAISFYAPEENDKKNAIEEFLNMKLKTLKVDSSFLEERVEKSIDDMNVSEMLAMEESFFENPKKKKKKKNKKK